MDTLLLAMAIAYFIPSLVALYRHHSSTGGILVINLFLGWTFIGWVIALAWACSGISRQFASPAAPLSPAASAPRDEPDRSLARYAGRYVRRHLARRRKDARTDGPRNAIVLGDDENASYAAGIEKWFENPIVYSVAIVVALVIMMLLALELFGPKPTSESRSLV